MIKMKKSIIFILIMALFVAGCSQQIICNKPYIQVGNECCLDKDNNSICDEDETVMKDLVDNQTSDELIETSETEIKEPTIVKETKIEENKSNSEEETPFSSQELKDGCRIKSTLERGETKKYSLDNKTFEVEAYKVYPDYVEMIVNGASLGQIYVGDPKLNIKGGNVREKDGIQFKLFATNWSKKTMTFGIDCHYVEEEPEEEKKTIQETDTTSNEQYSGGESPSISPYCMGYNYYENNKDQGLVVNKCGIECLTDSDCEGWRYKTSEEWYLLQKECNVYKCIDRHDSCEQRKDAIQNGEGIFSSMTLQEKQTALLGISCW